LPPALLWGAIAINLRLRFKVACDKHAQKKIVYLSEI